MKLNYKKAKSTFLILSLTLFASLFISYSVTNTQTGDGTTISSQIFERIEPMPEEIPYLDNCNPDLNQNKDVTYNNIMNFNQEYELGFGKTYYQAGIEFQMSYTQLYSIRDQHQRELTNLVSDCKSNPKSQYEPIPRIDFNEDLRNLPAGVNAPSVCNSFHGKLLQVDDFNIAITDINSLDEASYIELRDGREPLRQDFFDFKTSCINIINSQESTDITSGTNNSNNTNTTTGTNNSTNTDATSGTEDSTTSNSTNNTTDVYDDSTNTDTTSGTKDSTNNNATQYEQPQLIPKILLTNYNLPSNCYLSQQLKTDISSWNNNIAGKNFYSYNKTQQDHIESFRKNIENRINFRINECEEALDQTTSEQTNNSQTTTINNQEEEFFVPNIKMDYTCFDLVEAKQKVDDFYQEHKDLDFQSLSLEEQAPLRKEKENLWNNLYEQKRLCDLKKDLVQKYYTYEIKNEVAQEYTTNNEGNEEYNDSYEYRKFSYDENQGVVVFKDVNGEEKQISIQNHTKRRIISYINGEEHEQLIEPKDVAMLAHRIKKFKNVDNAQQFLEKVEEMNQKIEVKKDITYNKETGKSKVKIDVKSKVDESLKDISLYLVIPKDIALSANEINIVNDGGGTRFIVEKDPIIGWYFNDSETKGAIEYEVNGESEGGTIIVGQDPTLYNGPNLIINYRETSCNSDEAYLFDIDDLSDSKVYEKDSGKLYKVCIAHIDYILDNDFSESSVELLSFDNLGYVSFTKSFDNQVYLSAQSEDEIKWEIKVSNESPSNLYSCIGSVNDDSNSLFGDCEYSENKIWIALNKEESENVILSEEIEEEKIDYKLLVQDLATSKSFFFGFLIFIMLVCYIMYKRISNKVI